MPPAADAPNVLLLLADQHRPDWLETAGDVPVRTPNIARLAERGVEFTNAVCPSPVCGPSRACLASGRDYDRAGAPGGSGGWTLPLDRPTYYRALRDDGGYHVAGCGSIDLVGGSRMFLEHDALLDRLGFSDGVINAGKNASVKLYQDHGEPRDAYLAYLEERGLAETHAEDFQRRYDEGQFEATFPTPLPEDAYVDNWIARNGLELLDDAPEDRPWHLTVNFNGPHSPMDVTEEMHGRYRDPDVKFPSPVDPADEPSPETHQEIRRNYAAMIENIDDWVGRYLDELEARGELENTIVVYSSDHGELLGDHGLWSKFSPYHASVGVPLVVAGPGVESREPEREPVNLIDLQATFLDYAGVEQLPDADSRSLRPLLTGESTDHRDVVYSGFGAWRMAFDGRYKLVTGLDRERDHHQQGLEFLEDDDRSRREVAAERPTLLFDVTQGEQENVADQHPDRVQALRRRLEKHVGDADS